MSEKTESKNVYQRINQARRAVSYVKKDAEIGYGKSGYKAVAHDAVTAATRAAMIDNGIIVAPTLVSSRVEKTGAVTGGGAEWIRYEATYEVAFVNEDDPKDFVAVRMESHAIDYGDKAPGKAISYAVKYAILKLLSLETGEDDESRHDASETISLPGKKVNPNEAQETCGEADISKIKALLEATGSDRALMLKHFFSASIEALNKVQAATAIRMLEKKAAQKENKA